MDEVLSSFFAINLDTVNSTFNIVNRFQFKYNESANKRAPQILREITNETNF